MAALSLYLVGARGAGRSSVFDSLVTTPEGVSFRTRQSHRVASVKVPDDRLYQLRRLYKPKKYTPAEITFVDVGIPINGVESLTGLREILGDADAFVAVLQAFDDGSGKVDPREQAGNMMDELVLADLDLVETRLDRIAKENIHKKHAPQAEKQLLERCRKHLDSGHSLREMPFNDEEESIIKSLRLLSRKPVILLANVAEDNLHGNNLEELTAFAAAAGMEMICFCAPLEVEIARLAEDDRNDFLKNFGIEISARPKLIQAAYSILDLISFFTVGDDEVRAWTLPRNKATAIEAAGKIHSDIQRGFIRAEVVASDDLLATGSLAKCRENATLRIEGKNYQVNDGEVVHFRFNV